MLCMITESFRASAMRALPAPDRLAIACAHSFRPETRFTRVISTTAASYISVRASVSPHVVGCRNPRKSGAVPSLVRSLRVTVAVPLIRSRTFQGFQLLTRFANVSLAPLIPGLSTR